MGKKCRRIVLTGGPGGGKTTAADLFRRELGEKIVIVPEAATILYNGGFPHPNEWNARQATQRAIYHLQRNLEDAQALHYAGRILLCDRGTVDGAAYWPSTQSTEFFSHLETSLEDELNRYDAVIFFETAAVGGISIEGGNLTRRESLQEAVELDHKLRQLWEKHPHFSLIPHHLSFLNKISRGLNRLAEIVTQLNLYKSS